MGHTSVCMAVVLRVHLVRPQTAVLDSVYSLLKGDHRDIMSLFCLPRDTFGCSMHVVFLSDLTRPTADRHQLPVSIPRALSHLVCRSSSYPSPATISRFVFQYAGTSGGLRRPPDVVFYVVPLDINIIVYAICTSYIYRCTAHRSTIHLDK